MDEIGESRIEVSLRSARPTDNQAIGQPPWATIEEAAEARLSQGRQRRRGFVAALLVGGSMLVGVSLSGGEPSSPLDVAGAPLDLEPSATVDEEPPSSTSASIPSSEISTSVSAVKAPAPPPPEGAGESVGRCWTVRLGAAEEDACLFAPGVHMWSLGDETLLLSRGSISLSDGSQVEMDLDTRLAIAKLDDLEAPVTPEGLGCVQEVVAESVFEHLGPGSPPFTATACGSDFALVEVQHVDHDDRLIALLLITDEQANWSVVSELNFGLPAEERCAVVPEEQPGALGESLRSNCMLLNP